MFLLILLVVVYLLYFLTVYTLNSVCLPLGDMTSEEFHLTTGSDKLAVYLQGNAETVCHGWLTKILVEEGFDVYSSGYAKNMERTKDLLCRRVHDVAKNYKQVIVVARSIGTCFAPYLEHISSWTAYLTPVSSIHDMVMVHTGTLGAYINMCYSIRMGHKFAKGPHKVYAAKYDKVTPYMPTGAYEIMSDHNGIDADKRFLKVLREDIRSH